MKSALYMAYEINLSSSTLVAVPIYLDTLIDAASNTYPDMTGIQLQFYWDTRLMTLYTNSSGDVRFANMVGTTTTAYDEDEGEYVTSYTYPMGECNINHISEDIGYMTLAYASARAIEPGTYADLVNVSSSGAVNTALRNVTAQYVDTDTVDSNVVLVFFFELTAEGLTHETIPIYIAVNNDNTLNAYERFYTNIAVCSDTSVINALIETMDVANGYLKISSGYVRNFYKMTVVNGENGSVEGDPTLTETATAGTYTANVTPGGDFTLTVTPDSGYNASVTVGGEAVTLTDNGDGTFSCTVTGDASKEIVVSYTQSTPTTVSVTFNANGGTGTMAAQTINYNEATALNANTLTYEGYHFTGWNTQADGLGTAYADQANITATADVTLYAQWSAHDWSAWTYNGAAAKTHTRTCSVGGETETEACTFGDGVVTTPATCTATGVKTFTCSVCGGTYTEDIPATGHTVVVDEGIPATYTSTGLTEGSHCSVCGEILLAQTVVPMVAPTNLGAQAKTDGSAIRFGVQFDFETLKASFDVGDEVNIYFLVNAKHNFNADNPELLDNNGDPTGTRAVELANFKWLAEYEDMDVAQFVATLRESGIKVFDYSAANGTITFAVTITGMTGNEAMDVVFRPFIVEGATVDGAYNNCGIQKYNSVQRILEAYAGIIADGSSIVFPDEQ